MLVFTRRVHTTVGGKDPQKFDSIDFFWVTLKSCTIVFQSVCEAVDESTFAVAKRIERVPIEKEPMLIAILIAKLKQGFGEDYVILKNTLIGKNTVGTTQFARSTSNISICIRGRHN